MANIQLLDFRDRRHESDVSNREAVARVLDAVPAEHALTGVVHAAGVADDGVLESLDRDRLDAVLAPKAAFTGWPNLDAIVYALPDDLAGMAHDLYAALRDLDAKHVDVVIAALPPAVGLGEAVGDRLRRAAGPRGSKP